MYTGKVVLLRREIVCQYVNENKWIGVFSRSTNQPDDATSSTSTLSRLVVIRYQVTSLTSLMRNEFKKLNILLVLHNETIELNLLNIA